MSSGTVIVIIFSFRYMMTSPNGTFSALLAFCAGYSPVPGEYPVQRPVTRSFDVFFDLRLNKRLSKQSWGWRFETLPRPLSRHSNDKCHRYGTWVSCLRIQQWIIHSCKISKDGDRHGRLQIWITHKPSRNERVSNLILCMFKIRY